MLIGICLLVNVYSYLLFQYFNTKDSLAKEELFLENIREIRLQEEAKIKPIQDSTAVQRLEEVVLWLEKVPLPTVALLDSLTRLLPENGYFVELAYLDQERITIKIKFDKLSEVASYLHHVTATPLIKEAWLSEIKEEESFLTNVELDPEWKKAFSTPYYVAEYELVIQPVEVAALKGVK